MLDRLMGVITLKAPTYRAIADDKTATTPAAIVLIISLLVARFFGGLVQSTGQISIVGAIVGAIVGVILGLIGWVVSAWILAFVAKQLGGKTDTSEMLRVTGFVEVFSLVGVLDVLAAISSALLCVVGLVSLVAGILKLIGYVIGVREAAEFSTTNAIITAIIAAVINFIIVVVIGGAILAVIVGVGAVAGGGS